ncbi:MAG: hypothetical protein U0P30_16205 [Vicinamibacterales bacterium]
MASIGPDGGHGHLCVDRDERRIVDRDRVGRVGYRQRHRRLSRCAERRWCTNGHGRDRRADVHRDAGGGGAGLQLRRFDACAIEVGAAEAEDACRGVARYVPKVGNRSPKAEAREWRFSLRRAGTGWLIDRVEAR